MTQSIFLQSRWECRTQWSQRIRPVVPKWLIITTIFILGAMNNILDPVCLTTVDHHRPEPAGLVSEWSPGGLSGRSGLRVELSERRDPATNGDRRTGRVRVFGVLDQRGQLPRHRHQHVRRTGNNWSQHSQSARQTYK